MILVIDGIDRAGKSTLVQELIDKNTMFDKVFTTHFPTKRGLKTAKDFLNDFRENIPWEDVKNDFIGVSNFSARLIRDAQSHLKDVRLTANQVEYSLLDQKPAMVLLPYCRDEGITTVSYRPLVKGILAKPGHPVLDELAKQYKKTHAQVALNWLINQNGVVAIPKSANPVHLEENIGAVNVVQIPGKTKEDALLALERMLSLA